MNDHDIVGSTAGELFHRVTCACGDVFSRDTAEQARAAHGHHFGIEAARAALRGDT